MKLNLQETDYGNFLADEVSVNIPPIVEFSFAAKCNTEVCIQEVSRAVDVLKSPSDTASCPIHGLYDVRPTCVG